MKYNSYGLPYELYFIKFKYPQFPMVAGFDKMINK